MRFAYVPPLAARADAASGPASDALRPAPQTTLLLPLECLEVALVNLLVIYWPLLTLIYGIYSYRRPMSGWTVLFLVGLSGRSPLHCYAR